MQYYEKSPGQPSKAPNEHTDINFTNNDGIEKQHKYREISLHQRNLLPHLEQQKHTFNHKLQQEIHTEQSLHNRFPKVEFGCNVQLIGIANIHIGNGSCISDNSWLNVCFRDDKIRLNIGKRVLVGRGSMLSAGGLLELGDYCLLAPQVFISDANHVYANITRPYMDQGATSGHLVVEENCWLGIHAVIAGNLTVGRGSVISANAVVTKDVPPFAVMGGVPAHVIKLFNFKTTKWENIRGSSHLSDILAQREAYPPPPRVTYAAMLRKNSATTFIDPILAGRGQCL
ncbi:MAG: acyltransferase [Verrucomicrobiae bacterium]|nr:acyltransferase [Verrucomicrobiae bacterium]